MKFDLAGWCPSTERAVSIEIINALPAYSFCSALLGTFFIVGIGGVSATGHCLWTARQMCMFSRGCAYGQETVIAEAII